MTTDYTQATLSSSSRAVCHFFPPETRHYRVPGRGDREISIRTALCSRTAEASDFETIIVGSVDPGQTRYCLKCLTALEEKGREEAGIIEIDAPTAESLRGEDAQFSDTFATVLLAERYLKTKRIELEKRGCTVVSTEVVSPFDRGLGDPGLHRIHDMSTKLPHPKRFIARIRAVPPVRLIARLEVGLKVLKRLHGQSHEHGRLLTTVTLTEEGSNRSSIFTVAKLVGVGRTLELCTQTKQPGLFEETIESAISVYQKQLDSLLSILDAQE